MANRLAHAQSLYLRKHADNPIDWWSWCDEALETARREDKPIFLSIGYSSCHWCTVMEGEAFSDPQIAAYMNANFLPIKVDREERPDLDSIYMQALQMMVGQGGWPLNIFLSPDDRVPFFGGTYFPVEPRYGRPGFLQVLEAIRSYYDTQKEKLRSVKDEILANLQGMASLQPAAALNADLLKNGLEYSTGILTSKSPGPSFPMIPYAEAAQRGMRISMRYDAREVTQQRGLDLALGGIFDHVAGGFHRYTVDPTWTVPHFEKMLYDNGQIVEYLANLWSAGVTPTAFERAVRRTVEWLTREMRSPAGYFYAAQDADSFTLPTAVEPEEGAFYVWEYSTLAQLLTPEELAALTEQFSITRNGNFEGHIVLQRHQPGALSETVETALAKLFQVRYGAAAAQIPQVQPATNNQEAKTGNWQGRIPPVTDPKMIVAWNSLMISGLARSAAVFAQPHYLELAMQAATVILDRQWVDGRFHRVYYAEVSDPSSGQASVLAQSEDYALFIKALLDIHQARLAIAPSSMEDLSAPEFWLAKAVTVQEEFDDLWSIELGGYYNTAAQSDLVVRERSYADNATPAANGIAAANLVRLALLTEDLAYLEKAEQTLQAFGEVMQRSPQSCPSLFSALDWFRNHTLIRTTPEQIAQLAKQYLPTVVLKSEPLPTGVVGLVCQGLSCQEPARSLEQLQEQVYQSQRRNVG